MEGPEFVEAPKQMSGPRGGSFQDLGGPWRLKQLALFRAVMDLLFADDIRPQDRGAVETPKRELVRYISMRRQGQGWYPYRYSCGFRGGPLVTL